MGLSIRAYARHRGVSHVAVKKAIDSGRITPEADGTIDPDRADRDWTRNSEPPKAGTGARAAKVRVADDPAPNLATGLPAGGTTLVQARTVNEVVKAQIAGSRSIGLDRVGRLLGGSHLVVVTD
ncbi:MAG: hypothetical protein ACK4TK_13260, partial [Thiobacillaceae bacterium]